MRDDRSPRVKYDHLYTVWSKFKNRSAKEKEILIEAGKANANMLDGCGNATSTVPHTGFMPDIRYCLKNTYKIPEEKLIGRYLYERYYYECPYCKAHVVSDIDPEMDDPETDTTCHNCGKEFVI